MTKRYLGSLASVLFVGGFLWWLLTVATEFYLIRQEALLTALATYAKANQLAVETTVPSTVELFEQIRPLFESGVMSIFACAISLVFLLLMMWAPFIPAVEQVIKEDFADTGVPYVLLFCLVLMMIVVGLSAIRTSPENLAGSPRG